MLLFTEEDSEAGFTTTSWRNIVVEEGPNNFGAYVADLPGCVAVGRSEEEVLHLIHEAIEFHLEDTDDLKGSGLSFRQLPARRA
ncbi:MAG: type II toxin-antitoxin system HicB family antitoxin [Nitrospira sp.]|nr:MAG: type II toxin-antitoxin system HicB family antitoxin [Nitrospira sp.]